MRKLLTITTSIAALLLLCSPSVYAVRLMTTPGTAPGSPPASFDFIALTPDGQTIIASGVLDTSSADDRVFSIPLNTLDATQISTGSFIVNNYDVDFPPVISPDGQTILFSHDGNDDATNTIYTMPITGEGDNPFTPFFTSDPNLVGSGTGNYSAKYSPNGTKVFFINTNDGFGGSIPDFTTPESPTAWSNPAWDTLWASDADGSNPVAVTQPVDGDIDYGLFDTTPDGATIIFAPDIPVAARDTINESHRVLKSIASTGGASTEIPIAPSGHAFDIDSKLQVSNDGQDVYFIADYDTPGQNELYSVPITGGSPTKLSDAVAFGGDVHTFAVSPDGASIAYVAGQNASHTNELFLKSIGGANGSSIRINDPAVANSGEHDVGTGAEGSVVFAPDGLSVYYVGDMDTASANDIYTVDLTEKVGLTPSSFTFIGPADGDFFDENNWQDADGNSPTAGLIDPGVPIRLSLIIDGDSVTSSGGEADFQTGGSLELTTGSVLSFTNSGDILDFNPGSGFKLTDATVLVDDDIVLEGTNYLLGGSITSTADDIEFQDSHDTFVDGTSFSSGDNLFFENSSTTIRNATFASADRVGLRYGLEIAVTNTLINIQDGAGDADDVFGVADSDLGVNTALADNAVLRLLGTSELRADSIGEGVDLILEDQAVANLGGLDSDIVSVGLDPAAFQEWESTITVNSTDAEIILGATSAIDARGLIINGLTGLTYLDDPTAWNVSNWDGVAAVASLKLLGGGLDGDFNDDGVVDAADYAVWRNNLGQNAAALNGNGTGDLSGMVVQADYGLWRTNYGNTSTLTADALGAVPEPTAILLLACVVPSACRRKRLRHGSV